MLYIEHYNTLKKKNQMSSLFLLFHSILYKNQKTFEHVYFFMVE